MKKETKLIRVSQDTLDMLDSIKHPGQSYSGILTEMFNDLKEEAKKQNISLSELLNKEEK